MVHVVCILWQSAIDDHNVNLILMVHVIIHYGSLSRIFRQKIITL